MIPSLVACLLAVGTLPLAAQKPKTLKPGFNLYSTDQDIQLGKEAAAEVEKQAALVNNSELTGYIKRIASKLTAQEEAGKYPYNFKVVYDKSINAFALPGGPAFVHTGLIQSADNEAQIAGVLAHEISHVALRHGTNQATKAQAVQLLAGIGGSMMGGGLLGQLAQIGAGLGANSLLLKFSRSAEADADMLGTRIMAKAGYDPMELANFFHKLESAGKSSNSLIAQFTSDHPTPGNRVKAVGDEVKLLRTTSSDKGDLAQLKRMQQVIGGLPVPAKANTNVRAAGSGLDAARPSGQMQKYQGKGLTFVYPSNWQIFTSQQSSEITAASRDGIVDSNGNAEIGYGAILGVAQSQSRGNLAQATQTYLNQMMQQNRNMKPSGQQPSTVRVAGGNAMLNIFYNASPFPSQKEVDAVVTVEHPQGLFYLILIAPESEYSKAQPSFEQMIQSVQFQ